MELYTLAWNKSYPVFKAIIEHPFNQELMNGKLAFSKFTYYLEQDSIYTPAEAKIETLIYYKIPDEYKEDFKQYIIDAKSYEAWLELFFRSNPNATKTENITSATMNYVNHFDASAIIPVEVALAKVLPCFCFYKELGIYMSNHPVENNPYQSFIDSYSGEEFVNSTNRYIDIFNEVAEQSSLEVSQQMIEAFYQSAIHEWHFFNDAYKMEFFDEFF